MKLQALCAVIREMRRKMKKIAQFPPEQRFGCQTSTNNLVLITHSITKAVCSSEKQQIKINKRCFLTSFYKICKTEIPVSAQ